MEQASDLLAGFAVVTTIPVFWGDQDTFGHVNNTVYLRWAETARIEYLKRAGLWERKAVDNVGPILAAISCKYRRPVTYPDQVLVGTRVTTLGNSSYHMEHRIVSAAQGVVAAEVDSTLVQFDYNRGKSFAMGDRERRGIEALEGRELGPRHHHI